MTFKDHFSHVATAYAAHRPHYPPELFAYVAAQCIRRERAVDCGTGNGQAAIGLAAHFNEVIATDPSPQQIAQGLPAAGVRYVVAPAEQLPVANGSVDLVTAASAAHWFDLPMFYREVQRVLRPGGTIALWTYYEAFVNGTIDPIIHRFQHEIVGPYWPPERAPVDDRYRTLPFPFKERLAPAFTSTAQMTAAELMAYFRTWSAVARYKQGTGHDPVQLIEQELREAWGTGRQEVRWPLAMRIGTAG